jgi:CRP-like cAMP-binding protein
MPAASAFLDRLRPGDKAALAGAGHPRRYRAGETLMMSGDPGIFVVLITSGRVKVVAASPTGSETVLSLRGPGDLIGELAAIDDEGAPRTATVTALDPVVCRVIHAREFREMLSDHAGIAVELLRTVAAKLRASDRQRVEFGAYDSTRRLARLLSEMAETSGRPSDSGILLPSGLTQEDLAGLVGASRESVARGLAALRARGFVVTGRRSVLVVDPGGLRSYGR